MQMMRQSDNDDIDLRILQYVVNLIRICDTINSGPVCFLQIPGIDRLDFHGIPAGQNKRRVVTVRALAVADKTDLHFIHDYLLRMSSHDRRGRSSDASYRRRCRHSHR